MYYLEKHGSVLLGYESPAHPLQTLARSSPADFMLLSGLLNKSLFPVACVLTAYHNQKFRCVRIQTEEKIRSRKLRNHLIKNPRRFLKTCKD